ncbi:glycosyltransferase family 4 protein [Streptococcus pantholopis]|uniref:Glycosyl transferase family 1 n=1 Tax=Streptococcus pantholopis TaxID=1811193 RepID=A0A172Q683_9STRE|nr:glycosyltransferase family 4 protein [Streptococcus pantholopis]AND78966.1 glycosyl transferase family 1 [Streptococcus pantholopis]
MKVLLYLEAENYLRKSGIGRAIKHQKRALDLVGQAYTTDPDEDYDLVHINTYGFKSWRLMSKAQKAGKKVIMHGHSTEEDFRDSFIGSNLLAPLFRRHLCHFYRKADAIITPTVYSKALIEGYGINKPIYAVSNGIDLSRYTKDKEKEKAFRDYFGLSADQKVVMCAGLYFIRKGIDEFVQVAEAMPDVRFIWFGETNKLVIPQRVRRIVAKKHPDNVTFAGYIKGDVFEGAMSGSDAFFFPSREETEGIVVLEALASRQQLVLRDIPVYQGWLDKSEAEFASDVSGFVAALRFVLGGSNDKPQKGYAVAESRSLDRVGRQLVEVYEKVMEL